MLLVFLLPSHGFTSGLSSPKLALLLGFPSPSAAFPAGVSLVITCLCCLSFPCPPLHSLLVFLWLTCLRSWSFPALNCFPCWSFPCSPGFTIGLFLALPCFSCCSFPHPHLPLLLVFPWPSPVFRAALSLAHLASLLAFPLITCLCCRYFSRSHLSSLLIFPLPSHGFTFVFHPIIWLHCWSFPHSPIFAAILSLVHLSLLLVFTLPSPSFVADLCLTLFCLCCLAVPHSPAFAIGAEVS